jgi:hypothetical protein
MEFKAIEPGIEVNGQTIYAIVDGFKMAKGVPERILLDKGIGKKVNEKFQIDPNGWYPQQAWLDSFKEISSKMGDLALSQIGMKIPENAEFPSWVNDIDSGIKSVDIAYHMNHRKNGKVMFDPNSGKMLEGIGHYGYNRNEDEQVILSECNTPYPCAFDMGILTAMARKFHPKAIVTHDDTMPCRKKGNESCMYKIRW